MHTSLLDLPTRDKSRAKGSYVIAGLVLRPQSDRLMYERGDRSWGFARFVSLGSQHAYIIGRDESSNSEVKILPGQCYLANGDVVEPRVVSGLAEQPGAYTYRVRDAVSVVVRIELRPKHDELTYQASDGRWITARYLRTDAAYFILAGPEGETRAPPSRSYLAPSHGSELKMVHSVDE